MRGRVMCGSSKRMYSCLAPSSIREWSTYELLAQKKRLPGAAIDLRDEAGKLAGFVGANPSNQFGGRRVAKPGTLVTGRSSRARKHGQARPAIGGIGEPLDEPIGLEPIDKLRDVRLHARQSFGQLPQGKRLAGLAQRRQGRELGDRQSN